MKILLPLDLVQPVEPTIASLDALIDLSKADVKLIYVREVLPAYENALRSAGNFSDDWEKTWDETARKALDLAAALLKGKCKSVISEIATGSAALTIETVARDEGFDITVLVPRERHGVERFFGGSVTNKVLQHAPNTVLILRNKPHKLNTALIGHDGSNNSSFAITKALECFRIKESSKVCLIHAVDLAEPIKLLGPVEFVAALEQNALMQGEVFLAQGEKILQDAGIKHADLALIEDDPAAGVITMAKEISADLVVIGAQGHTAVQHFLIGSVSHKIATHLACSVAVVKPAPSKK